MQGDSPVHADICCLSRVVWLYRRVGLFGSTALTKWCTSLKAKYQQKTDSKQVLWRKDAKNFERRVEECLKLLEGKHLTLAYVQLSPNIVLSYSVCFTASDSSLKGDKLSLPSLCVRDCLYNFTLVRELRERLQSGLLPNWLWFLVSLMEANWLTIYNGCAYLAG